MVGMMSFSLYFDCTLLQREKHVAKREVVEGKKRVTKREVEGKKRVTKREVVEGKKCVTKREVEGKRGQDIITVNDGH